MPADQAIASPHRIALITGGLRLGGSTTFLINFAGELVRRRIPVEVISFESENPLASDFQKQHIPVMCLDQQRWIFEDRLISVLRRLDHFQPTVVISTLGAVSFEVLRYLPSGIFRIGMGQSDDPIVYEMMRQYTPFIDMIAMVSKAMCEKAHAVPEFAKTTINYLSYGVPMCPTMELPVRNLTTPMRILYLGRLGREQKRVHLFPEIFQQLQKSGVPFEWTIAGEGNERDFLEANLKTTSPTQTVSFTGPVRYADVPDLLKRHDIFLLASDYEGLPLSLLEAMGNGLVPVVSDLKSGIPEVVDASCGCLVPVQDIAGYARTIIQLHENRADFAAKSVIARQRVQKDFSVAAMTDRWLAALPARPPSPSAWPQRWKISAPLTAEKKWPFSPPVRIVRRLLKKPALKGNQPA